MNLALVKNPPIAKTSVQLLGIKVPSIKEVGERLRESGDFLYPGEPQVVLRERPADSPYKTVYLRDPDGNEIDVSEEGWEVVSRLLKRSSGEARIIRDRIVES